VNILDDLIPEPGSYYIMDRGYVDFARIYTLTQFCAFFVTRAKTNLRFRRVYSRPVDKSLGLRCDQTIVLTGFYSAKDYPDKLRRTRYYDTETDKLLTFLSNSFIIPALTIARLYKCRWQIELFFRWIKQHLRIKEFYGTSKNAVKTQIWIAISVYVLVAIIKKRLDLDLSLYTILQILSVTAFEQVPILQVLTNFGYKADADDSDKQLLLIDL
jgi:IS4 transposase